LSVFGATTGAKELRLEVKGAKTPRLIRNWPVAVLPKAAFLKSAKTDSISPRQNLLSAQKKPRKGTIVFVSRRSMDGLAEILTYVFNDRPFTTEELALSLDALRLWRDTIDQAGIAPDFMTTAREKEYLAQLLRHQNPDGGFAPYRGGESAMDATAVAVIALSARNSGLADPARNLAVAWLKQRLANTWFDETERAQRAAAYAALAAADVLDPASLHYFSDTSASISLPAVAEAHIAAAFKRIKEPNAAAFWIKKMLDENGRQRTISLLNALSATDALSSDDVLAATAEMGAALRAGAAPEIKDAAALLRTIAINNAVAGKGRIANKEGSRPVFGVLALPFSNAASYLNDDAQPLYITSVLEADTEPTSLLRGASLERRVFRLDGVELSPESQLAQGEIHLVAIKSKMPSSIQNARILIQEGGNGLRPIGCPLSKELDMQSIVPWLTSREMTPIISCEFSPLGINVVLPSPENEPLSFSAVYFARVDARTIADIPLPRLQILK
jgi:hypothetical protein